MATPTTWGDLAVENLRAAKLLYRSGFARKSVHCAYYAAYCAVTEQLVARNLTFAHDWRNPSHETLRAMVENNLPLDENSKRECKRMLLVLRSNREDADYPPGVTIAAQDALHSVQEASRLLRIFGIIDVEEKKP